MVRKRTICGSEKLEQNAVLWTYVVNAGFHSVTLKCLEYPAAIAVVATAGGGCDCVC